MTKYTLTDIDMRISRTAGVWHFSARAIALESESDESLGAALADARTQLSSRIEAAHAVGRESLTARARRRLDLALELYEALDGLA